MAADYSKLDLPKLTADAAKYPKAGVPPERMDFWSNLESSLLELHQIPKVHNCEEWFSLVHGLQAKKLTPAEHQAPPVMSNQITEACAKDRQPIPEVCRATQLVDNWTILFLQRVARKPERGREHPGSNHQPRNLCQQ